MWCEAVTTQQALTISYVHTPVYKLESYCFRGFCKIVLICFVRPLWTQQSSFQISVFFARSCIVAASNQYPENANFILQVGKGKHPPSNCISEILSQFPVPPE